MTPFATKGAGLSVLLVWAILSCGTDTPLAEYTPSSDQESALKNILLDFQDGVNRRDAVKLADLIHEDATLSVGREHNRLSKPYYVKVLPQRLMANLPIALGKPKMMLSGNTADVSIYMTRGDARFLFTFHLTHDNQRWTISGWTY
jgi:hypothetical protein